MNGVRRRLDGRVALITGGGSGIGRAVAIRLAAEGAVVAVAGRRADALAETCARVAREGGTAEPFTADLSSAAACADLVAAVTRRFRRLEILVNAAGKHGGSSLLEVSETEWDELFAVNAKSMFFTLQAGARVMQAAGWGRIVNFSSIAGRGFRRSVNPPYVGSKAAVIGITRLAALALAPTVNVNCVVPGVTANDEYMRRVANGADAEGVGPDDARRRMEEFIPLRRSNTPADVAALVAFLVSEDARNITGQSINVDGGLVYDAGY
jgi:NAD(P)-dependent dehydrogenase (short-subunit alcohol dehydrogenase family)